MAEGEFAKKKILITGVGGGKCLFWQLLILEVIIVQSLLYGNINSFILIGLLGPNIPQSQQKIWKFSWKNKMLRIA